MVGNWPGVLSSVFLFFLVVSCLCSSSVMGSGGAGRRRSLRWRTLVRGAAAAAGGAAVGETSLSWNLTRGEERSCGVEVATEPSTITQYTTFSLAEADPYWACWRWETCLSPIVLLVSARAVVTELKFVPSVCSAVFSFSFGVLGPDLIHYSSHSIKPITVKHTYTIQTN